MDNKTILFLTTSSLTTNPRLLKEVDTALELNYQVEIISFQYNNWSEKLDKIWISEHPGIRIYIISLSSNLNLLWLVSSFIEKIGKYLYPIFRKNLYVNAFVSTRRSGLLQHKLALLKNSKERFDLIIAHNLGALYPAWWLNFKTKVPFIFDMEDYYPGEHIISDPANEKNRREFLLKKLLPDATTVTFASPLIGEQLKKLVGETSIKNLALINNCFPSDEFEYHAQIFSLSSNLQIKSSLNQVVHFVWFSQNIAANRGLELIISEFDKHKDKVHLHLIGNLYEDFNKDWIEPHQEFITTYSPMPQKELNQFICKFDVGLALELPSADENRQICLTNKIWAYLQAGLYILATDTLAQVEFMNDHTEHGVIFETNQTCRGKDAERINMNSLGNSLENILSNINAIWEVKKDRFERAKAFSWEKESKKLQSLWASILIE